MKDIQANLSRARTPSPCTF